MIAISLTYGLEEPIMQPISGISSNTAQPSVPIAGADERKKSERSENEAQERRQKPVTDEYIPEEKPEPSGRYSPGKNEKRCTCNTDKVDREIERLKKQKQELERKISRETDENKAEDLKAKLAQAEKELRQKDNDTYRRQHAVYTYA